MPLTENGISAPTMGEIRDDNLLERWLRRLVAAGCRAELLAFCDNCLADNTSNELAWLDNVPPFPPPFFVFAVGFPRMGVAVDG